MSAATTGATSSYDFTTTTTGKWILSGEHAVLRDGTALVFPMPGFELSLAYTRTEEPLQCDFQGPYAETLVLLFWGLLEEGLQQLGKAGKAPTGRLLIENTIPVGMGLGFSAALCVALVRWFCWLGWVDNTQEALFLQAKQLEDHAHGQSSGADVMGVLQGKPVGFHRPSHTHDLVLTWTPRLYLSYAGHISVTTQCIQQVQALWKENTPQAQTIDTAMEAATQRCMYALSATDAAAGQAELAQGMTDAAQCFTDWGLMPHAIQEHTQTLKAAGALACKPTGAGNGGYVLSLWSGKPSQQQIQQYKLLAVV